MIYSNYIPPRAVLCYSLFAINYQVLDFLIERSAAPKFREFTHADGEDVCMREYVRAIGKENSTIHRKTIPIYLRVILRAG